MDDQQKYRLADTLNHHTYPQRVLILELCLLDNRYIRHKVETNLEAMRERRWPIERSNIRIYQDWLMQLEGAKSELQRLKECHMTVMEPERCYARGWHVAIWDEDMLARHLRRFGIIF